MGASALERLYRSNRRVLHRVYPDREGRATRACTGEHRNARGRRSNRASVPRIRTKSSCIAGQTRGAPRSTAVCADTVLDPGCAMAPYYDSLLAKTIVRAETGNVALAR